jgi:hypothetical protein
MQNQTEKYGVHVTATNREFLNMYKVLHETRGEKGVKYGLIVIKNCEVIKNHLDSLEAKAAPSPEFVELAIKAQKFIEAEDEAGLKSLEEENKEIVDARKKQLEEVNAALELEATLELKMINEKILPENLSAEQLETIFKLINS